MNPDHLRDYVITPTLIELKLYSPAAVNLLLLTAAQESRFLYLRQIQGPALGLWQMEPSTHSDLWNNYLRFKPDLGHMISQFASKKCHLNIPPTEMAGNLPYACAMARMQYYRRPEPLPDPLDIQALGGYWKKFYNTSKGKGSVQQFIRSARGIDLDGT